LLLSAVQLACKVIESCVRRAGIAAICAATTSPATPVIDGFA
jgi:hypothetical protein